MNLRAEELSEDIIGPTLRYLNSWSYNAEVLLLGTAATESHLGAKVEPVADNHIGIGIYHIDPNTHHSVWDDYLAFDPDLASLVRGLASQHAFLSDPDSELASNLAYATAIAWCIYKRENINLSTFSSISALANCWHKHYNTQAFKRPAVDFIDSFDLLNIELHMRAA